MFATPVVAQSARGPQPKSPIDWDKLRDETLQMLAEYMRINSSNPPGNEIETARYLKRVLDREGIPAQIADFLSELRSNHIDSPGVERNMTAILDEIERLNQQHLGAVESELTGFIKDAQAKLAD